MAIDVRQNAERRHPLVNVALMCAYAAPQTRMRKTNTDLVDMRYAMRSGRTAVFSPTAPTMGGKRKIEIVGFASGFITKSKKAWTHAGSDRSFFTVVVRLPEPGSHPEPFSSGHAHARTHKEGHVSARLDRDGHRIAADPTSAKYPE